MDAPWVVMKFGGGALSGRERWDHLVASARVRRDRGARVLLVLSAPRALAAELDGLTGAAVRGQQGPALDRIHQRLLDLGAALEVDAAPRAAGDLAELTRHALGISLLGDCSPRVRARVLALGETLVWRIATPFLAERLPGLTALDARDLLVAEPGQDYRHHLSATLHARPDPGLGIRLGFAPFVCTQASTATDGQGDVVRLGPGGGDLGAVVLAARIGAHHVELWSDAPAMTTADPRLVPEARVVARLGPAHAAEMAALGHRGVHPRALPPARDAGLPVELRSVLAPDSPGTTIDPAHTEPGVVALVARPGVSLVRLATPGRVPDPAFLSEVAEVFRDQGVVAGPTAVGDTELSIAVDLAANRADAELMDALARDLRRLGEVRVQAPCAAITAVGAARARDRAAMLATVGDPGLLAGPNPELGCTVVIAEGALGRVLRGLHDALVDARATPHHAPALAPPAWAVATLPEGPVCDVDTLDATLAWHRALPAGRVLVDPPPACLGWATSLGLPRAGRGAWIPETALFGTDGASRADVQAAIAGGAVVSVSNPELLERWPIWDAVEVHLQVDASSDPAELAERAARAGARVRGLAAPAGLRDWAAAADLLAPHRGAFPDLAVLDLGEGAVEHPDDPDASKVEEQLHTWRRLLPDLAFWLRLRVPRAAVGLVGRVVQTGPGGVAWFDRPVPTDVLGAVNLDRRGPPSPVRLTAGGTALPVSLVPPLEGDRVLLVGA